LAFSQTASKQVNTMFERSYKFRAKVWEYDGPSSWHFVTVPKKESAKIKGIFHIAKRGFGALPVRVTIGNTTWKTSIFPDSKSGTYVLPLKANVRKVEGLKKGTTASVSIEVLA
jgi:hypothetical protein